MLFKDVKRFYYLVIVIIFVINFAFLFFNNIKDNQLLLYIYMLMQKYIVHVLHFPKHDTQYYKYLLIHK